MSQPMTFFQRLLNLTHASKEAADLRFVVVTADGLQHLPLEQALQLIGPTATQVVTERVITEVVAENPLVPELLERVAGQQTQLDELSEELADVQVSVLKQLKKLTKVKFHPDESVALGEGALEDGATDRPNVAVGLCAGAGLEGAGNVLVGPYAGSEVDGELIDCTFVGHSAGFGGSEDMSNVTALGAYARATGDNQVALGDYRTNVVTHSGTHRRQDPRDMHEPAPIELGMDFVLSVQPIQYREDFRDAYIDWDSKPFEPDALRPCPEAPTLESSDPDYQGLVIAYRSDKAVWDREERAYAAALTQYQVDLAQWIEDNRLARITADGTHAGLRMHYGFNAGQMQEMCERFGIDPGFIHDHAVNGGEAVKTLTEGDLVAILWKAYQQLHATINSPQFVDQIASALYQRHQALTEATQAQTPVGSDLPAEG